MKGGAGCPKEALSRNFRIPFPHGRENFLGFRELHVKISPQLRASPQILLKEFEAPALFYSAQVEGF
jgi:hypothetical protein